MSSKKKKGTAPWAVCNNCKITLVHKDTSIHNEKCCPPNFHSWLHPFIFEEKLFSSIEIFQLEDKNLERIPKETRNDFVLMPYHVLQFCKIPIGDPVIIKGSEEVPFTPFIKIAWPMQEKIPDFCPLISKEVSDLNSLTAKHPVIVSKVEEVLVAKEIIVFLENEASLSDLDIVLLMLGKQNVNKIYCINNLILLKYYGRTMIFRILDLISLTDNNEENKKCFYVISHDTKWIISNKVAENKKLENPLRKLGGLNDIIMELNDELTFALKETPLPGLNAIKGILIHGPMGCGKTTLMESVAENFTNNIVKIECSQILSKVMEETENKLRKYFEKAIKISPSVVLIDDLDVLCSNSKTSEYEKRITATLALCLDKLNSEKKSVLVLATTSKIDQIDKMLRTSNRFGKEIEIYVPNSAQRFEILNSLLLDVDHNLCENDIKTIADSLHGFVGGDIVSLVSKAIFKNYKTHQNIGKISFNDFEWAMSRVKPSAMKEILVEIPNVKWEDIGGQDDLKLKLKQSIEWPLKHGESFKRLGITPPKGLLMYGPPGCSKTMIAKALATESNLNFISVKGPELFSKWVGESERAVRKVFRRARQVAPCIIFFDELDAIGGERTGSSNSNVQERVLAQMLTELDGVEPLENVTVVAATNRIDRIDPALIRPGRLDRIVYVPLPDLKTRKEIFKIHFKKTCVDDDVSIDELVEKTEGYSGAEVTAVCREAGLKALEENFDAEKVRRSHFLEALKIILPRTSNNILKICESYYNK